MVKLYIPANIPCDKINWNIVDDCTRSSNSLVSFKLPRSWNDDAAISMRCELYKMRLLRLLYVPTTRHLHLLEIIQCHFLIVRLRWCQKTNSYRILEITCIWTRYLRWNHFNKMECNRLHPFFVQQTAIIRRNISSLSQLKFTKKMWSLTNVDTKPNISNLWLKVTILSTSR